MRVSEYIKLHHLNRHDIKLVLSGDELGWADKLSDKICEIGGNIYFYQRLGIFKKLSSDDEGRSR